METPAAPATTTAAPKSKLGVAWTWIEDHAWLAVLAVVALFAFFFLPAFKELAYGALRAIIGVLIISALVYAWFRETGQTSIVSGTFAQKFKDLEAHHHVWVVMAMIGLAAYIVVECLVHP